MNSLKIAGQCDGVRCDMAMLVLPDVFERTWGIRSQPFWPTATQRVRERAPGFCFMAEVYWDMEWTLQQQGFDYTYDKRLYDRLRDRPRPAIGPRGIFSPEWITRSKMARFLENHDEPRAAAAFPSRGPRGGGRHHVPVAGIALLPRGAVFGTKETHFASPRPGARRTGRSKPESLLRAVAGCPSSVGRPRRAMAAARMQTCLGRQPHLGQLPGFRLARPRECAEAPGGGELCSELESQCYVGLPFGDLSGGPWRLQDQTWRRQATTAMATTWRPGVVPGPGSLAAPRLLLNRQDDGGRS